MLSSSVPRQTGYEIVIRTAPAPHVGLGSGTQLALALGHAMVDLQDHQRIGSADLARLVGRGRRSAIGVHGFFHGGFLVDAGQGQDSGPGRLLWQVAFPAAWRVLLILPRGQTGLFGNQELGAFASLPERELDLQQTDAMCRLLLLGMLPSIQDADLAAFGEALHDYNHRAGEMYRVVQGGPYSHALTGAIVQFLRELGVAGVGQSSWGPATFAVVDQERAPWVEHKTRERFGLTAEEIMCTQASADGAKSGR
jgi:beta-ribofuranosylaminobenzene 5'-phosphate synthase